MEKKKRRFRWWHVLLIVFGIPLLIFLYYYVSSLFLHVERYTVEADIGTPFRVVHLTDLHNAEFGKNNSRLIEKVAEQQPDAIFLTGDMLNEDDPNPTIVTTLVSGLREIAPVYCCYGNHDYNWEKKWGKDLREILSAAGATVLDCDYVDVEINGNAVRIGGYMGYWGQPHMMTQDPDKRQTEYQFFKDFKEKDLPANTCRLLLDHIPTGWLDWHYIDAYDTGIVFSGHYHGGIIRIPLLDRGVAAPYVGWWPPYTKGVFVGDNSTCILSAGLGLYKGFPRLNNPPEIVVADLVPKNR